jgi:chemotaxis protein MotB
MARRAKSKKGQSAPWLITFSDLMTLLLTFFVLLLSMSSMDTTMFTRISAHVRSLSAIPVSGLGRVPERLEILVRVLKHPHNILEKRKRLKDLLFPLDLLPKELAPGELEKNLSILEHPEGVDIVLTEGLLFAAGSSSLDEKGKKLLDALTPVI